MAVTPDKCWALPIEHLRDLLAVCPAWQDWVSVPPGTAATDAAAIAKARTYACDVPPGPQPGGYYEAADLTAIRPFAIVDTLDHANHALTIRVHTESGFVQNGSLVLSLEDNVDPGFAGDPAAAQVTFANRVGGVIEDLVGLARDNGRLAVTQIQTMTGAERSAEQEVGSIGDRFIVFVRVDYGV